MPPLHHHERRRQYPFEQLEAKWQRLWDERRAFHAPNPGDPDFDPAQPKYYVLDMFPYPSGAGLHVGHPEGYTATDIIARYKRMRGFNVLHPMGWDAFGLPAEQYAIKTGQHPRVTTEANVQRFKAQLQKIGLSYDWPREINTTDPGYFRWTQWIFLQLYNSYFDPELKKARPIRLLEDALSETPKHASEWQNNAYLFGTRSGSRGMSATARSEFVARSRLAYIAEIPVNWCPELGTVLANEEVVDGRSEVGGYPVMRRPMRQWMLRITAYAERLIDELEPLDWPAGIKLLQRNWIGRSEGAEVEFPIAGHAGNIRVFTTRPDTLYGATYMVLAPEHPLVDQIATAEARDAIRRYRAEVASKSDLERTDLAKDKTGVWTGAFALNPINGERIPIWIADYVLMSYGTGAIMAVPAHDERDWEFAQKYQLPIRAVVISGRVGVSPAGSGVSPERTSDQDKVREGETPSPAGGTPTLPETGEGFAVNSPLIDGLPTGAAKQKIIELLEARGHGRRTINYKLRDWLFSRQRYWGEPFPIVWRDGQHEPIPESELPLEPPPLDDFKPTGTGDPPLARATEWIRYSDAATRETNTMPQWAGSCWYYLRFCDPRNNERFVGTEAERYWMGATASEKGIKPQETGVKDHESNVNVGESDAKDSESDVKVGKSDANDRETDIKVGESDANVGEIDSEVDEVDADVGKVDVNVDEIDANVDEVDADIGKVDVDVDEVDANVGKVDVNVDEFDVNDGKVDARNATAQPGGVDLYVGGTEHAVLHLLYARFWHKVLFDLGYVSTVEPFQKLVNQGMILGEDGQKMSKRWGNVVDPLDVIAEYGADSLRLYEMFMGPLEQTKPWSMHGVEGVHRFLARVWRLVMSEAQDGSWELTGTLAETDLTPMQRKVVHATIKKVTEDIEALAFNTAIAQMMIFVNQFTNAEPRPVSALRTLLVLLNPFAPHLAEELWEQLRARFTGFEGSLTRHPWPEWNPEFLLEEEVEIVLQVNGKVRDRVRLRKDADDSEVKAAALGNPRVQEFAGPNPPRKIVIVKNKLVNVVASH